ncbi:EAL domain-containing protein [Pseudoalteromonas sp. JBTF-M23]|uniref:EAL domain-containing protein n=1 Tax=Pseudoalteromonas caenipelagi TaxID=2726988 RepID=A0A849VDR1_9GAMM|nr:EAL domain-containing protein [Pseudoalteromonas caenipelagi]NOU50074.1 EAL domain-containing protein [Pseudoalteromonas caenipelagi]
MHRSCVLIIFFCLLLVVFQGDAVALNSNTVNRMSTEEGLSQASISNIVQDKYGYVWIGTHLGLNRYDGDIVEIVKEPINLSTKHISLLKLLDSDTLFISTAFSGAYLLDVNTLNIEQVYSGRLITNTNAFSEITAAIKIGNSIYAGIDNFLYKIDLSTKRSTLVASLESHSYIRSLLRIDKQIMIGTNQGLFGLNLESLQLLKQEFLDPQVRTSLTDNIKLLKLDPAIGLLVGTVQGLYTIPLNNNSLELNAAYTLVPELNIWDHEITPYGELIATELGVYKINRSTKSAEELLSLQDSKYELSQTSVTDLMFDKHSNIWMATLNQGAYYWPMTSLRFQVLKATNESINNNNIWSIHQDSKGEIWLGTDNGMLRFSSLFDDNPKHYFKNTDPKAAYATNSVYQILEPNNLESDELFLETLTGLMLLNKHSGNTRLPPLRSKLITNPFETINWGAHLLPDQRVAFISRAGFFVYDVKSQQAKPLTHLTQQLDIDTAYKFLPPLPSRPNEYLLSTEQKLISYDEETGTISTIYEFVKQDSERYSVIDSWVATPDGTIWLASSIEGIIALDAKDLSVKFKIDTSSGNGSQTLYQIQPDNFGNLWISSQSGLIQLNIKTKQIKKFDVNHGLPNGEFNANASSVIKNAKLAFGTINGMVWFSPEDFVKTDSSETNLYITDISLMTRELEYFPNFLNTYPLVLKQDDLGLKIKFSNFDFSKQSIYEYSANLEGPTAIKFDNLKASYLFFNQLKPGYYTLTIEQKTLGNDTTVDVVKLPFKVENSLFNSTLAWVLYFVIGFTALLAWVRQNYNKRREIEAALHEVTVSKQQTEMALNTTRSGVWQVDLPSNLVTQNRNVDCSLSKSKTDKVPLRKYFEVIHPEDRSRVQLVWEQILNSTKNKQFSLTYRVKGNTQPWLWYHDIGQVLSFDEHGVPQKVMGIYTNVTEQKAVDLRATILGEAFSQVSDWILILDAELNPLSANTSFCKAFELNEETAIKELSFRKLAHVVGLNRLNSLLERMSNLEPNQNIRQELTVKTSHQNAHPIHLSINAISKNNERIEHYVIVISDLTEQKQAESELRYLANFDTLTKLPNRSLMLQHIEFALHNAKSSGKYCALLFIDLDKFKPINDAYGHHTGDQVLIKITERISEKLSDNCILGRQSGDEFLVLVKNVHSPNKLSELATLLLESLPNKIEIGGISMSISASIGVAMYPFDAKSPEMLIRNADIAMIHAKQAGRNGFKFFTSQMNSQFSRKLTLENALKTAYRDGEIYNCYQPIVNIISGRVVGVELLMRWKHQGESISPMDFIPIAEEVGLIELMTEQALKRALYELNSLIDSGKGFYLSLNLSAVHILKSDIAQNLINILQAFGLGPEVLRLEITESSLMEDTEKAKRSLHELKRAGFVLLLDDFGTGYSSLTYLNQFPIDIIKIDQGFVRKMNELSSNKSIIKTIYLLAQSLHMSCIAEGVETNEQLSFLKELGCHLMQGYYFSVPVSAKELEDIVGVSMH